MPVKLQELTGINCEINGRPFDKDEQSYLLTFGRVFSKEYLEFFMAKCEINFFLCVLKLVNKTVKQLALVFYLFLENAGSLSV